MLDIILWHTKFCCCCCCCCDMHNIQPRLYASTFSELKFPIIVEEYLRFFSNCVFISFHDHRQIFARSAISLEGDVSHAKFLSAYIDLLSSVWNQGIKTILHYSSVLLSVMKCCSPFLSVDYAKSETVTL